MIEAMKQALEALEAVLCNPEGKCCIEGSDMDRLEVDMALAAFRQTIEQAEKQKPVGVVYSVPVGQVVGPDDTLKFAHTVLSDDRLLLNQSLYHEPQPQREWVGLTDGQYRDIADQVIATLEDRKGVIDLCFEQELVDEIMLEVTETIKTAIEAKLKEKNQ